jgi:hypothetical protein
MDVTVTQAGADSLAVSILAGQTAGNEGTLHIKVMTAKEGRVLYEGDIGIAYLKSLDVTYLDIEFPGSPLLALNQRFDPAVPAYSISNAPTFFKIMVKALAPGDTPGPHSPWITIDGEYTGQGELEHVIIPAAASSTVNIRVELPHGAASRTYKIIVNRASDGAAASIVVGHVPAQTVYQVQSNINEGLDKNGLEINVLSAAASTGVALNQCVFTYDFTTPGPKIVTVMYAGLETTFDAWVVGLDALIVTGPAPITVVTGPPGSGGTVSPDIPGVYTLAPVPFEADYLSITAVKSAVPGIEDMELTIKRTEPTVNEGVMEGAVKKIPLAPGDNVITVTANLARDENEASLTWTFKIKRTPLASGGKFYVSAGGNDANAGDADTAPFATMGKALALIKDAGLGTVENAEFTIVVSGTITGEAGGSSGMMEIGASFPHIILEGAAGGGGTIKAAGKSVLRISGGAKVTLRDNLTLTGGNASFGGGVYVIGTDSSFTMAGGIIQGNTGAWGGGVYVAGDGVFEMTGGSIQGNTMSLYGGGVYVSSGGTFEMAGGFIQGNTGSSSGGGVYVNGIFDMIGGAIQNNNGSSGGGIYVFGDGSGFTMSGTAAVHDNTASANGGGVYVANSGSFIMSGTAAVHGNSVSGSSGSGGGGVYVTGDGSAFTMNGGTIEENEVTYTEAGGGGVCLSSSGAFTMTGGFIQGNTASVGGGVLIFHGTFTMKGNAVIQGNTASNGGGGVFVDNQSGSTFTKTGGTIAGSGAALPNTALGADNAVYLDSGKKRNLTAGTGINLYAEYTSIWDYGATESNWDLP